MAISSLPTHTPVGHRQPEPRHAANGAPRWDVIRFHLRTLMDVLHDRIAEQVEAYRHDVPERAISLDDDPVTCGFVVRREHSPECHLTVTPNIPTATIRMDYVFVTDHGIVTPPSAVVRLDPGHPHMWRFDDGSGVRLRTVAEVAGYLLAPLVDGAPRATAQPAAA